MDHDTARLRQASDRITAEKRFRTEMMKVLIPLPNKQASGDVPDARIHMQLYERAVRMRVYQCGLQWEKASNAEVRNITESA